jgi:aromatic ring-cleaving dioxygenase
MKWVYRNAQYHEQVDNKTCPHSKKSGRVPFKDAEYGALVE